MEKTSTKLCKHCKTEIPKDAKICPNCRKKQGGILGKVILGVVVMVIIGVMASGRDETPKKVADRFQEGVQDGFNETVNAETEAEAPTDTEEKSVFSLGETAELNGVQVTMTNYEESAGSNFNLPTEGNVFLLVEFEISNHSESEINVSSMLSFDGYVDEYAANVSFSASMEKENTSLDGTIAAGKNMKGWIGYEVPAEWKTMEIHFTEDVWNDSKFQFAITK